MSTSSSTSTSPSTPPSPSRVESPGPSSRDIAQQIVASYQTLGDKLWAKFTTFEGVFTKEWKRGLHRDTTFQQWALQHIPAPIILGNIKLHFSSIYDALSSRHKDYIVRLTDYLETSVWDLYFLFEHFTLHSRPVLEILVRVTKNWPELCLDKLLDLLRLARKERILSNTRGQRKNLWSFQIADAKAAESEIKKKLTVRFKKTAAPVQSTSNPIEGVEKQTENGAGQDKEVFSPGSLDAESQDILPGQPTSPSSNERTYAPAREPSPEGQPISLNNRRTTTKRPDVHQEASDLSIELPRANTRLDFGELFEGGSELLDDLHQNILHQRVHNDWKSEDWQSVDFGELGDDMNAGFSDEWDERNASEHSDDGHSETASQNLGDLTPTKSDMSGQANARDSTSPLHKSISPELSLSGLLPNVTFSRKTSQNRPIGSKKSLQDEKGTRPAKVSTTIAVKENRSPGRIQWQRMINNREMLRDDFVHFLSCSAECSPNILVLHPLYINMASRPTIAKNTAKFLRYQLLVIPLYHPEAVHFSLVVLEVATRSISHYDSIFSKKQFSEMKKYVYPWVASLFANTPDPLTISASSVSNGVSCGLIVAAWAKAIGENRSIPGSFNIKELQEHALKRLGNIKGDPNSTPYPKMKKTTDVTNLKEDNKLKPKDRDSAKPILDSPVAVLDAIKSYLSQASSLIADFHSARKGKITALEGTIQSNQALETTIRSALPQLSANVKRALDSQFSVSKSGRMKRMKLNTMQIFLSPLEQKPEGIDDNDLQLINLAHDTTLENLRGECIAADRELKVLAAEVIKAKEVEKRSVRELEVLKGRMNSVCMKLKETIVVLNGEQGLEEVVRYVDRTVEMFDAWQESAGVANWMIKAGEGLVIFHASACLEKAERGDTLERIEQYCGQFLKQDTETPMGEILGWRLLLFTVSKEVVGPHQA
ncbi:hypothetical protein IFR05_011669 [Cadophora sp. M221]|nr:hypothetical protein IFR05_011669 [Cadophora sp. M221]